MITTLVLALVSRGAAEDAPTPDFQSRVEAVEKEICRAPSRQVHEWEWWCGAYRGTHLQDLHGWSPWERCPGAGTWPANLELIVPTAIGGSEHLAAARLRSEVGSAVPLTPDGVSGPAFVTLRPRVALAPGVWILELPSGDPSRVGAGALRGICRLRVGVQEDHSPPTWRAEPVSQSVQPDDCCRCLPDLGLPFPWISLAGADDQTREQDLLWEVRVAGDGERAAPIRLFTARWGCRCVTEAAGVGVPVIVWPEPSWCPGAEPDPVPPGGLDLEIRPVDLAGNRGEARVVHIDPPPSPLSPVPPAPPPR